MRPQARQKILIVDDDPATVNMMRRMLAGDGREILVANTGEEALVQARTGVHLVVADFQMPGITGLDLLKQLKEEDLPAAVLMVSGEATVSVAVDAMKAGAFDFIQKPFEPELLRVRAAQALEIGRKAEELGALRRRLARRLESEMVIGVSPALGEVRRLVAAVAQTEVAVALYGETGTGKELVARTLHSASARNERPFVVVDCAALPEPLLENELFGHEAGAYTGADRPSPGLLAEANGGTVFIDEIGEMPLSLQSKLLRFLQTKEFRRVGARQLTRVDVRVICATNRDLAVEVERGGFRSDLFYRINVFPIRLPTLRERPEDIPLLADHFLRIACAEAKRSIEGFTAEAMAMLGRHGWPGNVRQLENAIRRMVVLALGPRIGPPDCEAVIGEQTGAAGRLPPFADGARLMTYRDARAQVLSWFEKSYLESILKTAQGHVVQAAKIAGVDRKSLWRMLKRHGVGRGQGAP